MQLDPFIDIDLFTKEINEDIHDLTEAMRTQTARAAFYGAMNARAEKQLATVKRTLKLIEAQLTKTLRAKLVKAEQELAEQENRKVEKITVDMVRAEVDLHPEARKWGGLMIEAEEIQAICRVAYDAFRTRREMLVSLGHLTREQLRTDVRIQSAKDAADGYRTRRAARRGEESQPAD